MYLRGVPATTVSLDSQCAVGVITAIEQGHSIPRSPNLHRDRDRVVEKIVALDDAEFQRQYRLSRVTFYRLLEQVFTFSGVEH